MGHASAARVDHRVRLSQPGRAAHRLRDQDSLAAGADRHTLRRHAHHRHQGPAGRIAQAHRERHHRLRDAAEAARGGYEPLRAQDLCRDQGRSRSRAAAQEIHGQCGRCHARADPAGSSRYDSQSLADVLVVSHHGRPWPPVPVHLLGIVLFPGAAQPGAAALAAAARAVQHSAAVDRRRGGLDHRRIRSPAVDDQRRAADDAERVEYRSE